MKIEHDISAAAPWVMFFMAPSEKPGSGWHANQLQSKEKRTDEPASVLRGPSQKWRFDIPTYVFVSEKCRTEANGIWIVCHWQNVKGGKKWVQGYCKKAITVQHQKSVVSKNLNYSS